MKRKNAMRNALFTSILSLLLCVSMLVSTTFAWFTDEVISGRNTIAAGNLDIELLANGNPVNEETVLFGKDVKGNAIKLWEPGMVVYENLQIVNKGTLDLKYRLSVDAYKENDLEGHKLSEVVKLAVLDQPIDKATANRADILEAAKAAGPISLSEFEMIGALEDTQSTANQAVVIFWEPGDNDNLYNANNGKQTSDNAPLFIEFKVNLFATQLVSENDSFGSDYDKGAAWTGSVDTNWYFEDPTAATFTIESAEELAGLAAIVNGTATAPSTTFAMRATPETVQDTFAGKTIKLANDLDLHDISWTPIGRIGKTSTDFTYAFKGTFDGQGNTISNLAVTNEGWAGVFGLAHGGVTIKNLSVDTASIQSNRMAGAIVGQIYGSIENCHVANATIMVTPNLVGTEYDNGDKVGGIVGWLGDNGNNRTLSNCSATNVQIGAYRDVAAIAGYVASSTTVSGCKVTNATITVDQSTNHYEDKDPNAGLIYGRTGGAIVEENNDTTDAENKIDATYSKNGLTLKQSNKDLILYLVPETYEAATVTVPEGVTAIGNYAFAYNANVETVVLASTVRDLGRGFDSSAVKKVVLNEGLKVISSRAFRSTTALEEVVISSTVKEIADNAFQKSAIKEIVIPANVETIGETAFGASLIEKVTFAGDIEIQGFAFRGCTKLREVIMKGDANFVPSTLNGRNSCWFCNGESNNPNTSNITFTVTSDEVKEKVLAAMGAERNNTTVIVDDGFEKVETTEQLADALSEAAPGAKIDATGVTIAPTGSIAETVHIPAGVTLKGATFEAGSQAYVVLNGSGEDVVFEECAFDGPGFGMFIIAGNDDGGANAVYENCVFEGQVAPNFVNNPEGTSTFNNCTFTLGSDGIGLVNCMGGTHTFNNCTFDYTGGATFGSNQYVRWNAVNSYSESYSTAVILNGCTFKNCGTQRFGGNSTLTVK